MEYRNKPQLRDALAAEYVLGTLAGGARRRFEAWLNQDAALRITVNEWETRLTPMAAAVREVTPPARVWQQIAGRIAPKGAARSASAGTHAPNPAPSLWESLAFWRGFGLTASAAAAALAVFVGVRPPEIVERVQIVERVVDRPIPVSDGTAAHQPSYVAALKDAKGNTVLMIYAGRKAGEMWVKYMGDSMPGEASLELWGLDAGGTPKSLGLHGQEHDQAARHCRQIARTLQDPGCEHGAHGGFEIRQAHRPGHVFRRMHDDVVTGQAAPHELLLDVIDQLGAGLAQPLREHEHQLHEDLAGQSGVQ